MMRLTYPPTITHPLGIMSAPTTSSRLTGTQWLICVIASIGFAFDIYELLMLPLVAPDALKEFGIKPGSDDFNRWISILFYVPAIVGGLIAAGVGALLSLPLLRLNGIWVAIATLAFAFPPGRYCWNRSRDCCSAGFDFASSNGVNVDTRYVFLIALPPSFTSRSSYMFAWAVMKSGYHCASLIARSSAARPSGSPVKFSPLTPLSFIAATYGAKVMVAEEYRVGGTCVIRGCVPKKFFVYASAFPEEFADAGGYGWTVGERDFDWPTLIANKDKEIARLEGLYRANLERAGLLQEGSRSSQRFLFKFPAGQADAAHEEDQQRQDDREEGMGVAQRVEGEVAFFAHGVITAAISDQRM